MTKSNDIADLVKKDIDARKKFGIKKYGVPLRANNGRDAIQDLYEELIDATQYCKQAMVERDEPVEMELDYLLALEVTRAVVEKHKKKRTKLSFEEWLNKEITKPR